MNDRPREERQTSDELTMNIGADGVALFDRKASIDGDVHLSEQLVAEPSRTHL